MLTYNTQPGASCAALCPCHVAPAGVCPLAAPSPAAPPPSAAATEAAPDSGEAAAAMSRSLGDLSQPQECGAAGRSMTFCGSLDRHTPRTAPQRPYGRRCKSTAHIVLQNNDAAKEASRPHEFHATSGPHAHVPPLEARGRARQRAAPPPPPPPPPPGQHGGGECGGWRRGGGGAACCPCRHWTTLCPAMSGHDPCHPCLHHYHHHHPAACPSTLLAPCCRPYASAPQEDVSRAASKSPTVRTFNSHRCYEEQCGAPRRAPGPVGLEAADSPPPSPRLAMRRRPSPSPRASPSPERRGAGGEDVPQPGTPQMPRRVPRMGAAAATAAAAAAAAATASSSAAPTQVCWRAARGVLVPPPPPPQHHHHHA